MAKQYKVRKKCLICKNVFYPSYAGSLYCNHCKNKKSEEQAKQTSKKKQVKPAKKAVKKAIKKAPSKKAKVKK